MIPSQNNRLPAGLSLTVNGYPRYRSLHGRFNRCFDRPEADASVAQADSGLPAGGLREAVYSGSQGRQVVLGRVPERGGAESLPEAEGGEVIYVITDGEHYKFGIAENASNRVRSLQTGHPARLRLVAVVDELVTHDNMRDQDMEMEQDIHAFLWEHRLTGEWMDGNAPMVRAVVELIKGRHFINLLTMINWEVTSLLEKSHKEYQTEQDRYDYRRLKKEGYSGCWRRTAAFKAGDPKKIKLT